MSENNESDIMQSSAEGTAISQAKYLDFQTMSMPK